MNDVYDVLEACLQLMENGMDIETILTRYPEFADELRPVLEASIQARQMDVFKPSPEVMRRGRAKLLQRAAEMRASKAPSRRRVIPIVQRWALTFSLTALFLMSGTGLVSASSNALPGENLYPVKRTWENVQLVFVFNTQRRDALESEFENERLREVSDLLAGKRNATIQFSGVLTQQNNLYYISGIRVMVVTSTQLPANPLQSGTAVSVIGHTNADGFVEAESIQLLPPGSVVPVGESESQMEDNNSPTPGPGTGSGTKSGNDSEGNNQNKGTNLKPLSFQMEGTIQSVNNNDVVINGQAAYLDQVRVSVGDKVKVEGYFSPDGKFIVTKVEVEKSDSNDGSGQNNGSGSDNKGNDNGGGGNNSGGGGDNSGGGGSGDGGGGGDSGGSGGGDGGGGGGGDSGGSGGGDH